MKKFKENFQKFNEKYEKIEKKLQKLNIEDAKKILNLSG